MFKIIKRLSVSILLASALSLSFSAPKLFAAALDPSSTACEAIGAASGATANDCTDPAGPDVNNTLTLAINVFSLIVGVAAVIMIIVGGLKYILSMGDSNNINSAKNTILYAVIGLVVVAFAQIIVRFVLDKT